VVLYGSVTLRRKLRLGVFENRVLRKIFGSKKYEVTREWRRLHKMQLYTLSFGDQIRKNEMDGKCSRYAKQERWGDLIERVQLEDIGVDGRVILRWNFMIWGGETVLDLYG
jgi:hypothetical protein